MRYFARLFNGLHGSGRATLLAFLGRARGRAGLAGRVPHLRPLPPAPAVPIEQSVQRNFLVCLETGTRIVALKRHLAKRLCMSPEEYRRKWGLPDDYPMVARNYAAQRRQALTGMPQGEKRLQKQ